MERFYIFTGDDLVKVREIALAEDRVGFDIETESLAPRAKIAGFSLHFPQAQASCYVPLHHQLEDGGVTGWGLRRDRLDWAWLNSLRVVTFNGPFDLGRFRFFYPEFEPISVGDAQLAAKMLQVKRWEGLKDLAESMGIRRETISIQEVLGEGVFNFTQAPLNDLTLAYTCQDSELAIEVESEILKRHLDRGKYPGFNQVYALECRLSPILGEMGCQGLPFDSDEFANQIDGVEIEAQQQFLSICAMLNRDSDSFKLSSAKRLSAALFNAPDHVAQPLKKTQHADLEYPGLGLNPATSKGKSGSYSTATENLTVIEDQHPVVHEIINWKKINSFLTRDAKQVDEWTINGSIHPNFVQVGEDGTSRIYAKSPNVIGLSKVTRKAMPPDAGCCYCHVDYKAAEFRLAMFFANEEGILRAMNEGRDAHTYTYSQMTGVPIEEVTREQRGVGKVLNFASLFGSEGFSVARSLRVEVPEAIRLLEQFWAAYPKLRQWCDFRQQYAREHARTYTILGRVRRLPGIFAKQWGVQKSEMRKAVNTACQGSCGDVLKIGMLNFDIVRRFPRSLLYAFHGRMVCPVYDACLLSFHETALENRELLESAIRDVFEVEVAIGPGSAVAIDRRPRTMKMPIDIGWSSQNWAGAMDG